MVPHERADLVKQRRQLHQAERNTKISNQLDLPARNWLDQFFTVTEFQENQKLVFLFLVNLI